MRLLITGGAGCLGSNLVEHYIGLGHEICVIDNFVTGQRGVIPPQTRLKVVEGSIADANLVNKTFESFKPSHVIHSAAAYSDPTNWHEDTATNVLGTIHIAKAALAHNVDKLVNFQTALCYGRPSSVPIRVEAPTAPFTSYGISKTAGEAYLQQSGLPVISLRLANICGPRLAIGPIPTFYKRLKAQQNCFCSSTTRDFLDMSDFLSLMDKVLQKDASTGIFNVSTGEGKTIHDVFVAVCKYLGIDTPEVPLVPPGPDDVPEIVLDPALTNQVFGWTAKVNFTDTVAKQLKWYDQFGVNNIFSHLASSTKVGD